MTSDEIKKIIFGYDKEDDIIEAYSNVIGATTDSVLRSVPTHNDAQSIYVSWAGNDSTGDGTRGNPFRTVGIGNANMTATFFNLVIDDSNEYNEEYKNIFLDTGYKLFSSEGNTPTFEFNFGVRIYSVRTASTGTTYYIESSNLNASDANPGTNPALPLKTIGQGITNSSDGDTIQINDNSIYQEALVIPGNYALLIKSDFGKAPTIKFTPNVNDAIIHWTPSASRTNIIEGIIFDGDGDSDSICANATFSGVTAYNSYLKVYSCEMKNFNEGVHCDGINFVTVEYCHIHDSVGGSGAGVRNFGIYITNGSVNDVVDTVISWNKIHGLRGYDTGPAVYISSGIYINASVSSLDGVNIENNIVYDCVGTCIEDQSTVFGTGFTVRNNSCFDGEISRILYAFKNIAGWGTYSVINNIAQSSVATQEFYADNALTITYCYSDQSLPHTNITFGTGCLDGTDAKYSSISYAVGINLGLKPNSPCRRTALGNIDMGARIYMFLITNNNTEINGIIFNGNDDIFKCTEMISATDLKIKWCDFTKFSGVAVNTGYDGLSATTNHIIENNSFYENSTGLSKQDGVDDSHDYNEFFKNRVAGVWENGSGASLEHCSFYGNYYGAYIGLGCTSLAFTNNAFLDDSFYAIYSESLAFSPTYCCVNGTINSIVDVSDPTNTFLSPLFIDIDNGEEDLRLRTFAAGFSYTSPCKDAGSSDIGAWQSAITVNAPSFTSFTLLNNPSDFETYFSKKFTKEQYTDFGDYDPYVKFTKRIIEMKWKTKDYSPDEQTEILEYISTLTTPIKIQLLGGDAIASGTAGVVDATALTLTDASLNLRPDALKGWWVTVQSWDFHILNNTKTVLTLDDPYGKLSNGSALTWSVEFLEMIPNVRKRFNGKRPVFFLEMNRTGYSMSFIEV